MKKYLSLFSLIVCIGLISCQDDGNPSFGGGGLLYPGLGWEYKSFCFAIYDDKGNNIETHEDFKISDLILEYEGKIFLAKKDLHQKIDENDNTKADWHNSIIFEPYPSGGDYPLTWRIWGHTPLNGETVQYILRYKDNVWVCDFKQWPREEEGKDPESELYVNGGKVEEQLLFLLENDPEYPDPSFREFWRYVLYTK